MRIRGMEQRLEEATMAVKGLEEALNRYEAAKDAIAMLSSYLGSENWRQDLSNDEKGLLPHDLKRGVLSEDGIWNLLEDNHELAIRMRTMSDMILNK